MPVWHEKTQALREEGKLHVVGITQEQHPDRCRLFAQWHGIDWPILWDPFNLTGTHAVPTFTLVDEHGIVRSRRPGAAEFDAFLATTYPAPDEIPRPLKGPPDVVVEALGNEPTSDEWHAVSRLLWARGDDPTEALETMEHVLRSASDFDGDAAALFRLGVAHRMRYDSAWRRPGDFQRALDAWSGALRANPRQYIWRRRIQQYGPRPDKPYPFYDWVERAREEIRARGEVPVALPVALTRSERAGRDGAAEPTDDPVPAPDPEGTVPTEGAELIEVESAVAFDTSGRSGAAEVHLTVGPGSAEQATWHADGGEVAMWIEAPEGWTLRPQRMIAPPPGPPSATPGADRLHFECEVRPPEDFDGEATLEGYVLCPVCRTEDGVCLYVRKEFVVRLRRPAPVR
ncbi:MAG: hypothetical protein ACYTG6_02440 [Planctomycetota bacterium]